MAKTTELFLKNKKITVKGKEYSNYFVNCEIWGRTGEARIIPKDSFGYQLLEAMFDKAQEQGLEVILVRTVQRESNANGQSRIVKSYSAVYNDPDTDQTMEVSVKPYRASDEDWIANYITTTLKAEADELGEEVDNPSE